ncbi:MAG: ABC transporter permease [Patescibacteria group bacterium]
MTNPTLSLFTANIKMMLRDRQALFWNVFFPAMFLLVFGLFRFDQPVEFKLAIFDDAQNQASEQFVQQVAEVKAFTRNTDVVTFDDAKALLKEGKLDAIVTLPQSFGTAPVAGEPLVIHVIINEGNQQSGVVVSVLTQFLDQLTFAQTQTPQLYALETEGIVGKETKYLDFLMPGILGMGIMFASVIGVAISVAQAKERKILRRLRATPISAKTYLIAEVGGRIFIVLLEIALILGIGMGFFHIHLFGNLGLLVLATVIGSLPFLMLGFFVGGLAKSADSAGSMSNAVTTPMMFLSGVFFSPDMLPNIVARIVDFLPLTPLLKILRGIAIDGNTFMQYPFEFAVIGGWIVVAFFLAWRTFRFDKV